MYDLGQIYVISCILFIISIPLLIIQKVEIDVRYTLIMWLMNYSDF